MNSVDLYDKCFEAIIFWEKETFTNDPRDPGGATKWGITIALLRSIRPGSTVDDLKKMTRLDAKEIYYQAFWLQYKCEQFPAALALALFDGCVNQPALHVKKYMQQALGIPADGVFGKKTFAAAKACDVKHTLTEFMGRRAVRYATRENVTTYGRGWFNRMFDIHRRCVELL